MSEEIESYWIARIKNLTDKGILLWLLFAHGVGFIGGFSLLILSENTNIWTLIAWSCVVTGLSITSITAALVVILARKAGVVKLYDPAKVSPRVRKVEKVGKCFSDNFGNVFGYALLLAAVACIVFPNGALRELVEVEARLVFGAVFAVIGFYSLNVANRSGHAKEESAGRQEEGT